jgi:hypothetical protein
VEAGKGEENIHFLVKQENRMFNVAHTGSFLPAKPGR